MYPATINPAEMLALEDDFTFLDTLKWASVDDTATGTNAIDETQPYGWANIVTAASANDYHFMVGKKVFLPAKGKPIWFEARFTAPSTTGYKYFGLSSLLTSALSHDGDGILLAGTPGWFGAMFYDIPVTDGRHRLGFCVSHGTSGTTAKYVQVKASVPRNTVLEGAGAAVLEGIVSIDAAGSVVFVAGQKYRAGFVWDSGDGVTGLVTAWLLNESSGIRYTPVSFTLSADAATAGFPITPPGFPITLASILPMGVVYGVKSAGAAETFSLDYIRVAQKR